MIRVMPDPVTQKYRTVLAFDFGLRRIGVAVGQSLLQTVQPLTAVRSKKGTPDWSTIEKLQQEWHADCFVIGLPLNKDGSDNATTTATRKFADEMKKRFRVNVFFADERYSSISAENHLKQQRQCGERKQTVKKEDIDKVAAAVILQDWFMHTT